MCEEMAKLGNDLKNRLLKIAVKEGLDDGPNKGRILTVEEMKRLEL
jgi:hypothetical protein